MRADLDPRLSAGRIRSGPMGSSDDWGRAGAFFVQGPCGAELKIIASEGDYRDIDEGWEHVSVSVRNRCPNWPEMSFVKRLFWGPEETVVQFHPPESEYVNNHPFCLHLFRDGVNGHRLPPIILVGVKSLNLAEIDSPPRQSKGEG